MNWTPGKPALSLTFDVEQCTNFPYWESQWDTCKWQIDDGTKSYVAKLCEVAAEFDAKLQFFVLGGSLKQGEFDYLKAAADAGHALGNHTFSHVNIKAKSWDELGGMYRKDDPERFRHTAREKVWSDMRACNRAFELALGKTPVGFRSPGGFRDGLADSTELHDMFVKLGFAYVSTRYDFPAWEGGESWDDLVKAAEWSVRNLQPYRYDDALLEIPMMGPSDIHAFRNLDLERGQFLQLLQHCLRVAAQNGLMFSAIMHPAVMASQDPHGVVVRQLLADARKLRVPVITNDVVAEAMLKEAPVSSG